MQGQLLQALVEGKPVLVAGDILALQIGAKAGRPFLRRHADIAVGRILGSFQILASDHLSEMQVAS